MGLCGNFATKENSYGRMNVSAEKYTCSFLQNVIKLKRILSAIMMGLCNRWCMYHEVYQQLVVIFVPKPLTVSKWRIIVGHSLNHISCDSSWFSPDTGHRSSESCFSGSHLCMLTLLSIWTWKLPHQTFSQLYVLLPLTIQQMHVKS